MTLLQADGSARTMAVVVDEHFRGIVLIQLYCRIEKRLFLLLGGGKNKCVIDLCLFSPFFPSGEMDNW